MRWAFKGASNSAHWAAAAKVRLACCALAVGSQLAVAQTWTESTAPATNWTGVASSADGGNFAAVAAAGGIYTSSDSGRSWAIRGAPVATWQAIASSADGKTLVAAANDAGLYASTDFGLTWNAATVPVTNWYAVAISANGAVILAAAGGPAMAFGFAPPGPVYMSTDAGATWADTGLPSLPWLSVAVWANGTGLAAVPWTGGGASLLYTSTDSGATWTLMSFPVPYLTSLAASADGLWLWADIWSFPHCFGGSGCSALYLSTNSGTSWAQSDLYGPAGFSLVTSANGKTSAAAATGSSSSVIYRSLDAGLTWTADSPFTNWSALASSADGTIVVAAVNGGGIYTLKSAPTPNLDLSQKGTNLLLSWTVPSMGFVLQTSPDLNEANWLQVNGQATLNFTNLQYQWTGTTTSSRDFYRLKH